MMLLGVRILFLAGCLSVSHLLLGGLTGSTLEIFELNNRKGLKDDQGNVLIPARYEEIGWSDQSVDPLESTIGYKMNGFWGLTTLKDEQVTKALYRDFYPLKNNLIKASRSNSDAHFLYFGILDTKGEAKIGFQYYDIEASGTNYVASVYDHQEIFHGLISSSEETLIPFAYKKVSYAGSQVYTAMDENYKLALYTGEGMKLANDGFDSIYRVSDDKIIVSKEGKLGLMRNDGSYILEPFYKKLEVINDSTFQLTSYPEWHLIDQTNTRLKSLHYDELEPLGAGVYRAKTYEGDALVNISGQQLSNKSNWQVTYADDNFVVRKEVGKYFVYNQSGELFLQDAFDSLHFDGSYFYTLTYKSKRPLWDIYNTYGRKITRFPYQELKPAGAKMIPVRKDSYWGFIDFNGGLVVEHIFEQVHSYKEGMAAVEYVGLWGVVDTNGNWILSPQFDYCEILNKDVILTRLKGKTDLVTPDNEWLYTSNHTITPENNWLVESSSYGSFGLLTASGKKITNPEFDELIVPENDSLVLLRQNEYWWAVNKSGDIICGNESEYQMVAPLSESFFGVVKDDKYGFVDTNNKLRIANRYEDAYAFSEGRAAVKLMGRWGFIDKIERLVIQPVYDRVSPFVQGISIVARNNRFGLIDKAGMEVTGLDFDSIYYAGNDIFVLQQKNQFGTFHRKTAYTMPPRFNSLKALPNGLLISEKRALKGLINEKGIDLIPAIYTDIVYDPFKDLYLCMEPGKTETFYVN